MSRALAIASLLLSLAACSDRSPPTRVRAGEVDIAASLAPEAARVGENEIRLELRDAAGTPLGDADVRVDVTMAAMGAMPAMGGPARVRALGDGRFTADFALDMGGTWQVTVRATPKAGAPAVAEGSITVGTPGLRLEAATQAPPAAGAAAAPAEEHVHPGAHPAEFRFDPARLRQIGIRSEPVRREERDASVRAVGRVVWDETTLHDVTARVAGFAGDVEAAALGARVERGQVLFELYAPELFAAQREYLDALRARAAARDTTAPGRADGLAAAAERRLRLFGVDPADVAAIARRGAPQEFLPIRAPIGGYVVEKEIVAGGAVEMGARLYRIAPLDPVWIEAELYESELAHVAVGAPARVTLDHLPNRSFEARVAYLYPALERDRRTARVRLVLANPDAALRPDMYAAVRFERPLGARLFVPDTAVLRAGERSFVFVDLGEGRLRPQRVEIGAQGDGAVEIVSGVAEGDRVVVSGTFLVAGESRLRAALESW
jgi:Cu(I)/Ag(I) efflux system membrane fusion protein